jgi:death-on-curing protein
VIYLSLEDLMLMHEVLINRFGGSPGIRDQKALEAALYRPQSGYYKDLISQSAALFESLAINHPFIDGNKRVAFAAMDTFLRLNGLRIHATSKESHMKILSMFERQELKHHVIDEWLRSICKSSRSK